MARTAADATSTVVRSRRRTAMITLTLCLCGTVAALLQTIIVPVLGELPAALDTSADNVNWLVTATLVASAVATPVAGRLADSYGKRRVMLWCLAVMTAGSFLGAVSTGLPVAIGARALQGVGLALIPVGIATLRDELPSSRVALGISLMSATISVGAGVGLPLGGWIGEHLDFHWLFWVTGGAGLAVLLAVRAVVPPGTVRSGGRFDVVGALLLSTTLTLLLLALSKGGQWGWGSAATLGCVTGGILALAVLMPWEMRTRRPLVDLRLAARPAVLLANGSAAFAGFGMFSNLLVSTQVLQLPASTGFGLGLSSVTAGLLMAPAAMMMLVVAPFAAVLTRRVGPHVTLVVGAVVMAAAYVGRSLAPQTLGLLITGMLVVSLGTSLFYGAMPALVIRLVPVTETASATSLNTLARVFGTASSSAALTAAAAIGTQVIGGIAYPNETALVSLFWMSAASCAIAAALITPLLLRRSLLTGERQQVAVPDMELDVAALR